MTAESFVADVEDGMETELSRLGSSRALYADTGGEVSPETVLRAAATAELAAAETFEEYAGSEDGEVAATFAEAAEEERDHHEAVVAELGDHEPGELPALHQYLRGREGTAERLGAFVGRTVVAGRSNEHLAGFFAGQGETELAELFSGMGADLDGQLERATALLEDHCGEETTRVARAREAAEGAIEAAYGEYADGLRELGVDPKPIC